MSLILECRKFLITTVLASILVGPQTCFAVQAADFYAKPLFLSAEEPPLVMLVMGKNHKLFYEAYNDASDLNEDGVLDVGYRGQDESYTDANGDGSYSSGESFEDFNGDGEWTAGIDYYGYFDSFKCYDYDSGTGLFVPKDAPVDASGNAVKTCTGSNDGYWSGDLLNYLTMTRMDALRKVFYGGYRSTDSSTQTILKRTIIPQDAHSWGKEYLSVEHDGYDIRDYTPLPLPEEDKRHLFANTTLSADGEPLLRVLNNSRFRIWEWVSIEGPVAGSQCSENDVKVNCADSGGESWEVVPEGRFTGLTQSVYDIASASSSPGDHDAFDTLESTYANASYLYGSGSTDSIDSKGSDNNPYAPGEDQFLNIIEGTISVSESGTYTFAVDGDDSVEVMIGGSVIASWYGGHSYCNCNTHTGSVYLEAGVSYPIKYRHVEWAGNESYYLRWQKTSAASTITDYNVAVEVCDSNFLESNCSLYPNGGYKPVGLLQTHGEDDKMYFGLMTGSYEKNMSGGVLRKNISSITDEIDADSGQILSPAGGGIIDTLNKIRISDQFSYWTYQYSGGWLLNKPMEEGQFKDWGNPIAEMMFETIRYFAGKSSPISQYDYAENSWTTDEILGLTKADWQNPYETFERCAAPYMLVLSDIYPTFDSDQLPGANTNFAGTLDNNDFVTGANNTDIMNVSQLAQTISTVEELGSSASGKSYYIGQSDADYDGACTPKNTENIGDIRGMCPEEPTKQGSFYAAAVAYYGARHDINADTDGAQRVSTFAVGLASPLPKIEIAVPDGSETHTVTLVPFAKSIQYGDFHPTNSIVDFYVEKITPTYGKFRVNFEDVEQGADHDMDAIAEYEYSITDDNKVQINMYSTYAAGSEIQHMGYIISGTTADGTYLEVRDKDTAEGSDRHYALDTHPGELPGEGKENTDALPLTASRTFEISGNSAAQLLENPLYYAAKWGGLKESDETEDDNQDGILDATEDRNGNGKIDYLSSEDKNDNGVLDSDEDLNGNGILDEYNMIIPDKQDEWDEDGDGSPDNYFYVVNPLKLEEELSKSFAEMLRRSSSGTAASVVSGSRSGEGAVFQSVFYPEYKDSHGQLSQWAGMVRSMMIDAYGNMRVDMYANEAGTVITADESKGVHQLNFNNEDLNYNGILDTELDEDNNKNGILDEGEDLNNNGRLDHSVDEKDYDGDGRADRRDLIVVFANTKAQLWDDRNENGSLDIEDEITFSPDMPGWHDNGTLDTEDTNRNGELDAGEDINENGILDTEDQNGNGVLDTELVNSGYSLDKIAYNWNSNNWLNSYMMDSRSQRSYSQALDKRYIFTFVDSNGDMIADSSEVLDFVSETTPSEAELLDADNLFAYLTLYPNFDDKPEWVEDIENEGNLTAMQLEQAKREVDYIRGEDQDALTVGSYEIPAMRSRQYYDEKAELQSTWRLGDIVNSSPTVVEQPPEAYHTIYRDRSYAYFVARHQYRRNVVYTGGNDGMIHAFNAGFWDYETDSYLTAIAEPYRDTDGSGDYTPPSDKSYGDPYSDMDNSGTWTGANQTAYPLGSELWAYIPFSLLPHLYWLTETSYPHVYYNDLAPKIFDAKIYNYDANLDPNNNTYHQSDFQDPARPFGWATIMVVGMNMGGGNIAYDADRNDVPDGTMNSSFSILDVTNPEEPPVLLAEITLPGLGYTTCYPAAIPMRTKTSSDSGTTFSSNDWYLVFGSGPADVNGVPASRDAASAPSTTGTVGEARVLSEGISLQNAHLFVVDLVALVDGDGLGKRVEIIDENGDSIQVTRATTTAAYIEKFSENESFVAQPITVDFNLDFNADAIYFGTVAWDDASAKWGGRMRRLIIDNNIDTAAWVKVESGIDYADNFLLDLTATGDIVQPISSAINATLGDKEGFDIDGSGNRDTYDRDRWIYFGTGRYQSSSDEDDTAQQSFYGIMEPYNVASPFGFTWGEVDRLDLLDSTNITVYDNKTVTGHPAGAKTWDQMIEKMEDGTYQGWYYNFSESKERNLGQSAIVGGLVTYTTYIPSSDVCSPEGSSKLSARWYQTGTPYYKTIFEDANTWTDIDGDGVVDSGEVAIGAEISLGKGMTKTPAVHTGREDGSTAFVQTSTGDIVTIEQNEALSTKSKKTSWNQKQ